MSPSIARAKGPCARIHPGKVDWLDGTRASPPRGAAQLPPASGMRRGVPARGPHGRLDKRQRLALSLGWGSVGREVPGLPANIVSCGPQGSASAGLRAHSSPLAALDLAPGVCLGGTQGARTGTVTCICLPGTSAQGEKSPRKAPPETVPWLAHAMGEEGAGERGSSRDALTSTFCLTSSLPARSWFSVFCACSMWLQ